MPIFGLRKITTENA